MTNSAELSERDSLIQIYSDFHKDAYGFRPRYVNYHEFTLEELKADFARFQEVCRENNEYERLANERERAEFEKRVQSVIDMGAGDRETALRWIMDSYENHEFDYGVEGFCNFELRLGFTEYAKQLAIELQPIVQPKIDASMVERYSDVA